mgnify:CR=1 FL=1
MNRHLILGILGLVVLLFATLLAPVVSPYPLDYQENIIILEKESGREILYSPHPPSGRHPFGTDPYGYDLLTQILHGLKYTLAVSIIVSFLRILAGGLVGIPLGVLYGRKRESLLLKGLVGIPVFLFLYFLLFRVSFNSPISVSRLVILEISLLTLFGAPGVVESLRSKSAAVMEREFIEASHSCGAGKGHLILRHVLPHLREDFLLRFITEILLVLSLLGQLAIFNIFVGPTVYTQDPPLFHSATHEIAGLVGQYRHYLTNSRWLIIFPLLTYLFILGTFSSLFKGLTSLLLKRMHAVKYI